jgi:glycosyltransferase involved in cell wall biosynthesis
MTSPRVALLIGAYPPDVGDVQADTHALARALRRRGVVEPEVTTLWRDDADRPDAESRESGTELLDGVPVMTIGLASSSRVDPWLRRSYYPMRRTAARHFADELQQPLHDPADGVAVVHAVRLGREHLALRGLDEARARDLPFVLTPNHHPRWSRRAFPDPVWRKLYRAADAVVALTENERTMITDLGADADRVVVTGIGPMLAPVGVRPDALPESAQHFLLFLGQQHPYQRLDHAVDAFDLIARGDADLHLVVAGPTHPDTERTAAGSAHADRVHVLGEVHGSTKRWLLDHAAVLLCPSEQEAFGREVVEAASTGCPVVVANLPAVAEVVDRLAWGVVAGSTAGSLAEGARALLVNPPTGQARATAITRVQARFSWPALAETYEHAYLRLTAS